MSDHVPPDTLEQYVIGALEESSMRWVESHVQGCTPCAAALRREANLELRLVEVAEAGLPAVPVQRASKWPRYVAATVGLAAALLLALWNSERVVDATPKPVVRCTDSACVERAQFDGVLAVGPSNQLAVPRYDDSPNEHRSAP